MSEKERARQANGREFLFVCAVEISLHRRPFFFHNGHLHFHCRSRMRRFYRYPPLPPPSISIDCHNCAIRILKLFTFISNSQLLPASFPHAFLAVQPKAPTHCERGRRESVFIKCIQPPYPSLHPRPRPIYRYIYTSTSPIPLDRVAAAAYLSCRQQQKNSFSICKLIKVDWSKKAVQSECGRQLRYAVNGRNSQRALCQVYEN